MTKVILKSFISAVVFWFTLLFILYLGKARYTTNPTPTDDGAWMYVTNGNTLTAAKRNNLVNRSVFRAYLNSSQTISYNTNTKVYMNTEEFDTNNEFDTTTYRFTPKRAGKYFLTAQCVFSSVWDTYWWVTAIFKNWSVYTQGTWSPNWSATSNTSLVSVVVDVNGTSDYFEVYCRTNKSPSVSLWVWGSNTYFAGFRVE